MRLRRRIERAPFASAMAVTLASAGASFLLVRSVLEPSAPSEAPALFKVVELPPPKHTAKPFPLTPEPTGTTEEPAPTPSRGPEPPRTPSVSRSVAASQRVKLPVVTIEDLPSPQPVDPKVAEATQVFAATRALANTPIELLRGEAEALKGMSLVDPLPRVVRDRCSLAYLLLADGHATQAMADAELAAIDVKAPSKKALEHTAATLADAEQQAAVAQNAMTQCRTSLVVLVDAFRLDEIAELR